MNTGFIQAKNGHFSLNGEQIMLRGFGLGTWMNIEHMMSRIPGTEKRIRQTFAEVYGRENAEQFFNDYLNYFITEDDFVFLKSLGANTLRLALNYRHFEDDQAPGKYKEEGFRHLERVLALCRKHNIYAVLDMHTSPGGQNANWHADNNTGVAMFWEDASLRERMVNLWGYIANRYKADPVIAGFDIINEPNFVNDADAFNDFFERTIEKIRRVDINHIIFIEGTAWSKDFTIFRKLGGHQQALSFHFYPGQHACIFAAPEERIPVLEKIILDYVDLREKTGMPLWVGETGGRFSKNNISKGFNAIRETLALFEKHDISWSFWTYKDANTMSLVYPKAETMWMKMGKEFRPKWQVKGLRNTDISNEVFQMLEDKFSYPISDELKSKFSFRISALLDELHIVYLVKQKLQTVPWEEMKEYPKSFLWKNCEYWKELAGILIFFMNNPVKIKDQHSKDETVMYNFNKNMMGVEEIKEPACQCCGTVKIKETSQSAGCAPFDADSANQCSDSAGIENSKPAGSCCAGSCS
jgi:hypothetical protein